AAGAAEGRAVRAGLRRRQRRLRQGAAQRGGGSVAPGAARTRERTGKRTGAPGGTKRATADAQASPPASMNPVAAVMRREAINPVASASRRSRAARARVTWNASAQQATRRTASGNVSGQSWTAGA